MENLVVVLFIIPGFLFQNSVRSIQNIKESGNWSYLIPLALWSSVFILLAKLLNLLIKMIVPADFIEMAGRLRVYLGDIPHFYTLVLAAFLSLLFGIVIHKTYFWVNKQINQCVCPCYVNFLNRVRQFIQIILKLSFSNPTDDFIQMLYALSGRLVVLSLTSGKYYIGFLVNYSTDSSDQYKILSIAPIWSGAREKKDDYCVHYDTFYGKVNQEKFENDHPVEMIVPFNQINSISRFDKDLNEYFINVGKSKFTSGS